jgi:hypothetical protein
VDLIDAEALEFVGDEGRRPVLLEAEFGVLVEVAPPGRHLVLERGDAVEDWHGPMPRDRTGRLRSVPPLDVRA